jgi:hypothetical protein
MAIIVTVTVAVVTTPTVPVGLFIHVLIGPNL